MTWDPNKDKDSWGGKNEPPDLDEALLRLQQKLKRFFGGKTPSSSSGNAGMPQSPNSAGFLVVIMALGVLLIWALSGIFIVNPAEQAVVLRFGKYFETLGPGPHWIPRIIDTKIVQNVERVMDYSYSAQMLTKDENLVSVSVAVQYRIGDLEAYLFNVASPEDSLRQATSSALRQVVGNTTLDQIITEGREAWGINVQETLTRTLAKYKTGFVIVNVSPQPARAPENVQDAFDDAIKAQEDEKRFKEQAYAYMARVVPIAEGRAKRMLEEANAYAKQAVLKAQGEAAQFLALLPQFEKAPDVTTERLYLDSMQAIFKNSSKVLIDSKSANVLALPLDKLVPSLKSLSQTPKDLLGAADNSMMATDSQPYLARPTARPGRSE